MLLDCYRVTLATARQYIHVRVIIGLFQCNIWQQRDHIDTYYVHFEWNLDVCCHCTKALTYIKAPNSLKLNNSSRPLTQQFCLCYRIYILDWVHGITQLLLFVYFHLYRYLYVYWFIFWWHLHCIRFNCLLLIDREYAATLYGRLRTAGELLNLVWLSRRNRGTKKNTFRVRPKIRPGRGLAGRNTKLRPSPA